MALIQTSLIWVAYAIAVAILVLIASVFVYLYQTPRDRALSVTVVSIISLTALLATILLLPVDVALVSSTIRSSEGARKDWASEDRVNNILLSLKIVYYTLYSLDALLCLIVCPFTYFFYEEYDEVEAEEGRQTLASRFFGALKYTLIFVVLCVILLLVGLFIPTIADDKGEHKDLDYFKDLLTANRGERTLAFTIGLLVTLGTILNIVYTSVGMAILPISLIWSAPALSMPKLAANTASELELNRERQHQLEARSEGRQGGLDPRDQRELERLVRDERTLIRRERLAAEATGEGHALMKTWNKIGAVFRPVKLLAGIFLFLLSLVIFVSMLITGIDKASNSICKSHCGYILGHINIFQPINWIFVKSAKVFPVDYVLFLLLVLYLFSSSVVGLASISIRFLFWPIFKIRRGHTSPQAILMATVMLALIVLAINYVVALFVAPQYTAFGTQTYCDRPVDPRGGLPDCSTNRDSIKSCSQIANYPTARNICTPTVISTFINRITLNFPFFGVFDFWATFVFLGLFLMVAILSFIRPPKLGASAIDEDLEEEEEEGLLSSTGRRFQATWEDITGRAQRNNPVPPSA